MLFEEKEVSTLGNSRVVKLPKLNKGDKIYIIDDEMLELLRGTIIKEK